MNLRRLSWQVASFVLPLIFGVACALAIAAALGEDPLLVLQVMVQGAFGSATQIGYSLYYATPLMLTGLSVAWAFRAGLFNIGAEGQMTLGGLAMAVVGIVFAGAPPIIAIPLALFAAFMVGGLWGGFAGWMKAKRGCHEVLATILLNFVAYGLSSFLILNVFKDPVSQVPETKPVGAGYQLGQLSMIGGTSPVNWSLFIAVIALVVFWFIFKRTRLGFYQRLVGGAPMVGRFAGLSMDQQVILAMFFSGGFAALAGASPVLGFALKAREGFAGGAGFVGIAVALLGKNSPVGIFFSAILFGALTKGALDLDLDTEKVSRDLALVIQALVVIAVASQAGLQSFIADLRDRGGRR